MLQNKLTELLELLAYPEVGQSLSSKAYQKELGALRHWLDYHATNRARGQALALFELLAPFAPHFEDRELTQEYLYQNLFPKGEASQSYFRKVQSTLSRLIEDFLLQQYLQDVPRERDALLTKVYYQRGQHNWYVKSLEQQIKDNSAIREKGAAVFLQLALLSRKLYQAQVANLSPADSTVFLREYEQHLDHYYLLEKLILQNEWTEIETATQERKHPLAYDLLPNDTEHLLEQVHRLDPKFKVFELYLARLQQADQARLLTKQAILDTDVALSLLDRKRLLMWLINDTGRYLRQTQEEQAVYKELLKLYQFGLEESLLLSAGKLSSPTYFNIVMLSNLLGQYDFCARFIEAYTPFLREAFRPAAENWALAHYYYHTDALEDCLERVGTAYKKYDTYSLQIRTLEIKTRYTLLQRGEAEADFLETSLANALKWAANDRVFSVGLRQGFKNFVKMVQKISKQQGKARIDVTEKNKLKKALKKTKNIYSRAWLLAQIEAL